MIRTSLYSSIRNVLEKPPLLVPEDFHIRTADQQDHVDLIISYECGDGQYFKASLPLVKSNTKETQEPNSAFRIPLEYNPGELTLKERADAVGPDALLTFIESWIGRMVDDLEADPVIRLLLERDKRLQDLEEELSVIPEETPTAEQLRRLEVWLEERESQLRFQIERLDLDSQTKTERISALEQEFKHLKSRAGITGLRRFFRSAIGRIYRTAYDPNLPRLIENGKSFTGLLTNSTGIED